MVDFLAKKLSSTFLKINNTKKFSEKDINIVLREIKFAMLESDVNIRVVRIFLDDVKNEIFKENVIKKINPQNQIIAIIQKKLIKILGNNSTEININKKPIYIMIVGLQGSGKTTSCAKIANYYSVKKNKKVLVVGCDVRRPAAAEQLEKLILPVKNCDFFYQNKAKVETIVKKSLKICNSEKHDIVIFDTAGRNFSNEEDLNEITKLKKIIKPKEIIFVVDALAGQSIYDTVLKFNNALSLTGVILSKFDSESKSGAAFTIVNSYKLPIYFVGTGERIKDLDLYHPDRLAERILGKGDILTLVEKAKESIDEKSSKKMLNRILNGNFNLNDLIKQLNQIKKIGSIKSILKMMPGGNKIDNSKIEKTKSILNKIKVLSNSMTNNERENISLLTQPKRKSRIIKGSGSSEFNYNLMLKQITEMKKNFKKIREMMKNNM